MRSKIKFFAIALTTLLPCLAFADFKLSDFTGNYFAYSSSPGGVTAPNPSNVATTTISQFKLGRRGSGKISTLSVTNMFEAGNFATLTFTNLNISLQLTDPINGFGTFQVIDYPAIGSILTGTFVAKKVRNLKCGSVDKILFNVTGVEGSNPTILRSLAIVVAERQDR